MCSTVPTSKPTDANQRISHASTATHRRSALTALLVTQSAPAVILWPTVSVLVRTACETYTNFVHRRLDLNYFELYTDDASSWVVSKIDNVAPLPACAVSSSSVVSSATSAVVTQSSAIAPTLSSMVTVTATPTMIESSATETPCSTSPAMVSPFPSPVPYNPGSCVLEVHVEYAYV